jgi:hypothetical protein
MPIFSVHIDREQLAKTRTYGRAPRGERVVGTVPGQRTTATLISALRLSRVMARLAFVGATDTPTFQTFVAQALEPKLHAGDVVIWDNLVVGVCAQPNRELR